MQPSAIAQPVKLKAYVQAQLCTAYAVANKRHDTRALQAYLGHRDIPHTVRYSELSPTRFKDLWRD